MLLVASVLGLLAGCRSAQPAALDAELASCVPADTQLLAGVHLDQARANQTLQKLLMDWLAVLEPARDASQLLIAYNGKDLLWAGRGAFHGAPAGATLLNQHVAVAGPAALVQAAIAQHATGRTGASELVARAESIARAPVWAVAEGRARLPLQGNAANLNRLLGLADYNTFSIEVETGIALHAAGFCPSADKGRQLEETLRGLLSLAGSATRDRELAALLRQVQIRRDDRTVRADVSGSAETVERLLRAAER